MVEVKSFGQEQRITDFKAYRILIKYIFQLINKNDRSCSFRSPRDLSALTELTNSFPLANGPLHFAQTKDLGNELPRRAR